MFSLNPNKALFTAFAVCAFLISGNAAANPLMPAEKSPEAAESEQWNEIHRRIDVLESKIQASKESPSAFNPSITVFGNAIGCFSPTPKSSLNQSQAHDHHDHDGEDDHGHEGHDHGHGHAHARVQKQAAAPDGHSHPECANTFWVREVEVDLRASIDPYADGVVIVSFEQEHPGEFSVGIEEAYVVLKPGFQLKLGRFLSSFGRLNRIHTHDLPQMIRPKAAINFLGEHGLGQDGASAQFYVPTPGEANALTLNLETLFGAALPIGDADSPWPKFVGRLSWFFDLAEGHDADFGASALIQPRNPGPAFQVYGADFNYRWRPYILGDKKSFLLGGEMFAANHAAKTYFNKLPIGGFAWTQVQFNQNIYLGLRYSYDQGVTEKDQLNNSAGVFLTYYTTEFLRFRVGYDRVSNDIGFKDGRDLFMIELNFIFGSHPTEPYWVNR